MFCKNGTFCFAVYKKDLPRQKKKLTSAYGVS